MILDDIPRAWLVTFRLESRGHVVPGWENIVGGFPGVMEAREHGYFVEGGLRVVLIVACREVAQDLLAILGEPFRILSATTSEEIVRRSF